MDELIYHGKSYSQPIFYDSNSLFGAARLFLTTDDYYRFKFLDNKSRFFMSSEAHQAIDPVSRDLNFDLIITRASYINEEFNKLEPYIGDTFSHTFYGSMVPTLNVTGHLLETSSNHQKKIFTEWYREFFRINAVAKTKIAPSLLIRDTTYKVAFLDLSLGENGNNSEIIDVSFTCLVFSVFHFDNFADSKNAFQMMQYSPFAAELGLLTSRRPRP